MPALRWDAVSLAFLDLSYRDPATNVFEDASLKFYPNDRMLKTFSVDLVNPNHGPVSYKGTVMLLDGTAVDLPRSVTLDQRILIREDMKGHAIVLLRPEEVDFADRNVAQMDVDVRYEHAAACLAYQDTSTFRSSGQKAYFEYDFVNPNQADYDYRASYLPMNGLKRTTDWQTSGEENLVLPVGWAMQSRGWKCAIGRLARRRSDREVKDATSGSRRLEEDQKSDFPTEERHHGIHAVDVGVPVPRGVGPGLGGG